MQMKTRIGLGSVQPVLLSRYSRCGWDIIHWGHVKNSTHKPISYCQSSTVTMLGLHKDKDFQLAQSHLLWLFYKRSCETGVEDFILPIILQLRDPGTERSNGKSCLMIFLKQNRDPTDHQISQESFLNYLSPPAPQPPATATQKSKTWK
jgi:hypothetical protein